jgi:hypothetical protein
MFHYQGGSRKAANMQVRGMILAKASGLTQGPLSSWTRVSKRDLVGSTLGAGRKPVWACHRRRVAQHLATRVFHPEPLFHRHQGVGEGTQEPESP